MISGGGRGGGGYGTNNHSSNKSLCIIQIPVVLFLQELLSYQEGFSKHYADSLDGCGLAQEGKVRQAYYSLIRRITDPLHKTHRLELDK